MIIDGKCNGSVVHHGWYEQIGKWKVEARMKRMVGVSWENNNGKIICSCFTLTQKTWVESVSDLCKKQNKKQKKMGRGKYNRQTDIKVYLKYT